MSTQVCKKDVLQAVIFTDDFTTKTLSKDTTPSMLMPVLNVPLFDYMVETLMNSKIQEVFLYCSSHVDLIRDYLKGRHFYGITVSLIVSDGCRSLGDALRDIDTKGCIRGCFLLIRGDAFTNANLSALFDIHRSKVEEDRGTTMTLVLRNVGSTDDSLLSDETSLLVSDKSNNHVLHFGKLKKKEKRVKFQLKWLLERAETEIQTCQLDTHIYLCSPSVLSLFADNFDFQTIDDFIRGVLMNDEILDSRIYWHPLNKEDYALPLTSWKTYHLLTRDILVRYSFPLAPNSFPSLMGFICMPRCVYKHKTATLAKGCVLEESCLLGQNSTLGTNTTITRSVIAENCHIGDNTVIRDSYIFADVTIKSDCTITNSVLFSHCFIEKETQIDGCIFCSHVGVPYRVYPRRYNDAIIEAIDDPLKMIRMSDIADEFVYFKKNVIESDSSSSDYSSSEEDLTEHDSPVPDDTSMFLSEVIDSLLRGYQDKLKCDNLILEINSSRYAYNISMREVTYNVIKAILSLPLHYLSETKTPVDNENYQKNLRVMITYFNPIILNYVKNEDAQDDCLRAIEDVACTTAELVPFVQRLLHLFYNRYILSEESILKWYDAPEKAASIYSCEARNAVHSFVKWLRETEEEEGSTTDESDDD